jgi:carbonic anhydrase/acetyltransferase-like protein (isoleucine patch superfamily)
MATSITSNYPVPCFGNLIADASNGSGFGGSVLITNSSNSNKKNTSASLAFIVASAIDISGNTYIGVDGNTYGNSRGYQLLGINSGGIIGVRDYADVRISAIIDTESNASVTGVACTFSVAGNILNDPREAMRIASSGNVGIGTNNPQATLDVSGTVNIYNANGPGVIKLQGNSFNNIGVGNTTLTNITTGTNNTGFGLGTLASVTTGGSNTAVGHNALQYGTAGANNNTAVGFGALANNNANSNNTALGFEAFKTNNGSWKESTAIGYSAQPTASNQIMLGTSKETVVIAGNSNVNGNVIIQSTLSNALGDVNTGSLQVDGGAGIAGNVSIGGNVNIRSNLYVGATNPPSIIGNTLHVQGTLYVSGTATAQSFNAYSDYRMKNNIQILTESKSIDILNPVEYDLPGGLHDMGFLAHEVQEIFPFLVTGIKDGSKMQSLNYNGFIALLVKEIKDIKKRLADTEETVKQLMKK